MVKLLHLTLAVAAMSLQPAICPAVLVEVSPDDDWFAWLAQGDLKPGDELVLREGVYSDARRLVVRHCGLETKPIVIRAAKGERVTFRRPDRKQNTFNLEGTQFLVLKGLEITGGAAAIRIGPDADRKQAHHVTLEDLHIHHIGGVAVTCNFAGAEYRRMMFRRNHIHHTSGHGEAFYLGANNGAATIFDSIIENNYVHDLNGPDISQGDGIEIKSGSYGNVVSGNVIHDTKYPAITVYGTNGRKRNLIANNVIWNTGDHGIQAAADAIVRRNFIADAGGCGIYSREHQNAAPSNLRLERNHIMASQNPAIRLIGSTRQPRGIELLSNTLIGSVGRLTVRIDSIDTLTADNNRGIGRIQGSRQVQASWKTIEEARVQLPDLPSNPAWKFMARSRVQELFSP